MKKCNVPRDCAYPATAGRKRTSNRPSTKHTHTSETHSPYVPPLYRIMMIAIGQKISTNPAFRKIKYFRRHLDTTNLLLRRLCGATNDSQIKEVSKTNLVEATKTNLVEATIPRSTRSRWNIESIARLVSPERQRSAEMKRLVVKRGQRNRDRRETHEA